MVDGSGSEAGAGGTGILRVTFLGTSAARPTSGRNVSALAVQRGGERFLFDCGEGTQRQMMRYRTGFGVNHVFVTHTHADHILGIPGLLRTMALEGRTDPIRVLGPPGSFRELREIVEVGQGSARLPVTVEEAAPGPVFRGNGFRLEAFPVSHGRSAVGWALVEDERRGRFDAELADRLGVPGGPVRGRLHRGEDVEVDGKFLRGRDFVGPARRGRKVVYTGDTRPAVTTIDHARAADLLVHEATFTGDESARARETFHSTASEAARVAMQSGVRRLILTHVSARYSDDPKPLRDEARAIFPETVVARDGMSIEVALPDDENGAP